MNRSLASGSYNLRSASSLAKAAVVDSDDTQSLTSELSRVSISEETISTSAKTARQNSARPPLDGKEKTQASSKPDNSSTIRGGRLVKKRPDERDVTQSTLSATEIPKWRRFDADRSSTAILGSGSEIPLARNHSSPNRPHWRERAPQNSEAYKSCSRSPAANGYNAHWQGSRSSASNSPFRETSARKSEPSVRDQKSSSSIRQTRSKGISLAQQSDNGITASSVSAHRNTNESTKFKPVTQSSKTPLHLQHPFRALPSGTTFDISQAIHSEQVTERHPSPEYFELASMSPNVYYSNDPEPNVNPVDSRKLVVLDLNGAMLVRSKRSNNPAANIGRRVYPRPFLDAFLDYIFAPARPETSQSSSPNPPEPDLQEMRPYEAFVWSSAQPVNVDNMIRFAFGKWAVPVSPNPQEKVDCEEWLSHIERVENRPERILGVWTRDEMDLTRQQYGRKSTTYKDLDKVFNHFANLTITNAEHSRFYRPDPDFAPSGYSTLLIDDSTIKACMQPFNHIPIPEFDLDSLRRGDIVLQNAKPGYGRDTVENSALDGCDDTVKQKASTLRMIFGCSAPEFYSRHVSSESPASPSTKEPPTLDGILLGVIGILSEVKDVINLPAWIAAGGLLPDIRQTFTQDMAAHGWENVVLVDSKLCKDAENWSSDAITSNPPGHQIPTLLPSHPEYMHWFESPPHLLYWVRRGLVALNERGVKAK